MILDERSLPRLPARFALVDGCFDPLHRGHVEYFRFAQGLGLPVVCNLAADGYLEEHKGRPPLLPEQDRAAVIDALRYVDHVFIARRGTAWSLRQLKPRFYVKGADWRGRLPADQVAICDELSIDIVYADCVLDSSTRILERFLENQRAHTRV